MGEDKAIIARLDIIIERQKIILEKLDKLASGTKNNCKICRFESEK